MNLIYPINFVGHDEWMNSGYALDHAKGEVITRDGEVLGSWRIVDYKPAADHETEDGGGCYEFIPYGQDEVKFGEAFAFLECRLSRGLALSTMARAIRNWHEPQAT